MTYEELKKLYREDCSVYYRTMSVFHLTRAKLCEQAIVDAIANKHSDCKDRMFSSLLTDFTLGNFEQESESKRDADFMRLNRHATNY